MAKLIFFCDYRAIVCENNAERLGMGGMDVTFYNNVTCYNNVTPAGFVDGDNVCNNVTCYNNVTPAGFVDGDNVCDNVTCYNNVTPAGFVDGDNVWGGDLTPKGCNYYNMAPTHHTPHPTPSAGGVGRRGMPPFYNNITPAGFVDGDNKYVFRGCTYGDNNTFFGAAHTATIKYFC